LWRAGRSRTVTVELHFRAICGLPEREHSGDAVLLIVLAAAHAMLKRRVGHSEGLSTTPPGHPLVRLSYSGFPF